MSQLQEALSTIRAIQRHQVLYNEEQYRTACETVIDHIMELTERVYIDLPGGLSGNADPVWNKVRANSGERCSCGNERVIKPGNPRKIYEPSEAETVVVSPDNKVTVRPIGGDKSSAYVELSIVREMLAFLDEPCAPLVLTPDIFSIKGSDLSDLAKVISEHTERLILFTYDGIPVLAVSAVDLENRTVTVTLDRSVEVFDPDKEPNGHQH